MQLNANAQMSYGGGLSLTNFMNTTGVDGQKSIMPGIHGHIEVPRSGDVTLYGRATFLFPKADLNTNIDYLPAINANTNPYALPVNYQLKTRFINIEGGNRYYIGNDYDNGFAGFGGSGLSLMYGKNYKLYEDTDTSGQISWSSNYQINPSSGLSKNYFLICGFLQGGVKYTFPSVGTIYADLSISYPLISNYNNVITDDFYTRFISAFILNFGIGFKKDLY